MRCKQLLRSGGLSPTNPSIGHCGPHERIGASSVASQANSGLLEKVVKPDTFRCSLLAKDGEFFDRRCRRPGMG